MERCSSGLTRISGGGGCSLLGGPAFGLSFLMVLEVSREFWNICEIVLCSESIFVGTINDVNRNSPVFCLGRKVTTSRARW